MSWVEKEYDSHRYCSNCGKAAFVQLTNLRPEYDYNWEEELEFTGNVEYDEENVLTDYCPWCGADMREEIKNISLELSDGYSIELNPDVEPSRYADFVALPEPKPFSEWSCGKPESLVQVHSTECGFCGVFAWDGYMIHPLDYDSYNKDMKVIAYSYFNNEDGERCLDILVGNDW